MLPEWHQWFIHLPQRAYLSPVENQKILKELLLGKMSKVDPSVRQNFLELTLDLRWHTHSIPCIGRTPPGLKKQGRRQQGATSYKAEKQ